MIIEMNGRLCGWRGKVLGFVALAGFALHSADTVAGKGGDVSTEVLEAHNKERAKVGVPALKWDAGLAKLATEWARKLCRPSKSLPTLQHRPRRPNSPGENLWEGATTEATGYPIAEAVQAWVEEKKFFDAKSGQCKGGVCGHYTQLVWRDSTHVGCGTARCSAGAFHATVWVCNYRPAGNMLGERPF